MKLQVNVLICIALWSMPPQTAKANEFVNDTSIYSIYDSFHDLVMAEDAKYFSVNRISPIEDEGKAVYHGFFFYNCSPQELPQFDPEGRYMLGMRVFIEGRMVQADDKAEIGYFDLKNRNEWIKVGETTAWNWQQGCRLQWLPGSSSEFIWNDRSANGEELVSRIYNIATNTIRTLPFPIYTISPDSKTALSVNFERIVHAGCDYVGIKDPYEDIWAPDKIGVWKMDMESGNRELLISVKDMAEIMYPDGLPSDTTNGKLYVFREGFNITGDRFIVFMKDAREVDIGRTSTRTHGYSMNMEGEEVKYLYKEPSHHFWINDEEIMDNGFHRDPVSGETVRGYFRFLDDGSGEPKSKYFDAPNGHITLHSNKEWIITDTYNINGFIYLYMYHIPTGSFVPIANLPYKLGGHLYPYNPGPLRVDLHPRFTPDGRSVAIDSSHEGYGRQMYIIDISTIIDNPPVK